MKTNLRTKTFTPEPTTLRPRRLKAEQGRITAGKVILRQTVLPVLRSAAAWLLCAVLLGAALSSLHAQHRFTRLHSFGATNLAMFAPGHLTAGRDGALYGTTGSSGRTVVRMSQGGSDYTVLCSVPASNGFPIVVLEGTDGALYGTTFAEFGVTGIVFKVNNDGTGFTVLHTFRHSPTSQGEAALVLFEGSDRALYGTTFGFFPTDQGTVFKLKKDGSGFAVLRTFLESAGDGTNPQALLEGSDGALYGTELGCWGRPMEAGTAFKLNKDGTDFGVFHRFQGRDGEGAMILPVVRKKWSISCMASSE